MTAHARLAASAAHRWMNCAGAPRMEAGRPDVDTEFSIEGTAAHDLAARMLRHVTFSDIDAVSWLTAAPFVVVRRKDGDDVEVPVTPEMCDALLLYASVVRDAMEEAGLGAKLYIEQKVSLAALNPPEAMFGTADAVIVAPDLIHVIDLKYGTGVVVEVVDNPQLMQYALGAHYSLPGVGEWDHMTFRTTIVQPRAYHPDGLVRECEYTWPEIEAFGKKLMDAAHLAAAPDAGLTPGAWCRWCKAAAFCTALAKASQEAARTEFVDLTHPDDKYVGDVVSVSGFSRAVAHAGRLKDDAFAASIPDAEFEVTPPDPETLPIEFVAAVLAKSEMVEAFLAAVKARALRTLLEGGDVPGFKVVESRGIREWIDAQAVENWAAGGGWAGPGEIYERKLRSPAQLEKIGGKKNLPPGLWRKVSKSVKVVPNDDKRPAIPAGPRDAFAMLDNPGDPGET